MELRCLLPRNIAFMCHLLWLSSIRFANASALQNETQNTTEVLQLHVEPFIHSVQNETESTEAIDFSVGFIEPVFLFLSSAAGQAVKHTWDKQQDTPEQYQWTYCGKTCNGTSVVTDKRYKCTSVKCIRCFCQRPSCEIYGLCCPEYSVYGDLSQNKNTNEGNNGNFVTLLENVNPPNSAKEDESETNDGSQKEDGKQHEVYNDLGNAYNRTSASKIVCAFSYWGYYLYIQSCPDDYPDSGIKSLCENDNDPITGVTEDTVTRVSDTVDGVVYFNRFCAICNGAKEIIPWKVELACQHYMTVYNATSMDQLLTNSLRQGSACTIDQFPQPQSFEIPSCQNAPHYNYEPEGTCNSTGLWQSYDEDVERTCLELQGRHFSTFYYSYEAELQKKGRYRNIFCAICNMEDYPEYGNCNSELDDTSHTVPIRQTPPFSILLGFRRKSLLSSRPVYVSSFTFSKCSNDQWSSPDGRCLALRCSPGKSMRNGTCTTALDQIRGLGYKLSVFFYNDRDRSCSGDTVQNITDKLTFEDIHNMFLIQVMGTLFSSVDAFDLQIGAAVTLDSKSFENGSSRYRQIPKLPSLLWLQGYVEAKRQMSRDDVEIELLDGFVNNNVTLKYLDFETNLTSRIFWDQSAVVDLCLQPDIDCSLKMEKHVTSGSALFRHTSSFLSVSNTLNCPSVQFSRDAYEIQTLYDDASLPQNVVTVRIGKTSLVFSKPNEINDLFLDSDQVLVVCKDALDSKLNSIDEERRREFYSRNFQAEADDITQAQYYMTLGCVGASMACLALALVTYFRFRVLRTSAGWNNIFLCGSLLTAQASLLASAHVSGPQTACTALGMMTHFLWLWMFTWSFICCFHMFRVFTSKTRQERSRQSQKSSFFGTVALSFLIPAAIVCTVITASHITSGGDRTGYGHESCYLDSTLLIGITTALPLALVTGSNIVFFSITVVKISNVKKLQSRDFSKQEDRRNLYIYVKLSTMTGIFWSIQLLAEATDLDILRFLAIVTNGLQGMFIFVSYIWNKRVLNLYASSLGRPMEPTTSTSDSQRRTNRSTLGGLTSQAHTIDYTCENPEGADVASSSEDKKSSILTVEEIAATLSRHDRRRDRHSVDSSCFSEVHCAVGDARVGSRSLSSCHKENDNKQE